jgi:hypothetical protein
LFIDIRPAPQFRAFNASEYRPKNANEEDIKEEHMQRLVMAFTAMAVLAFSGSLVRTAQAIPLSSASGATSPRNYSPTEKIGCDKSGKCPYGKRVVRKGGGKWSCAPCGSQKQESKHGDGDNRNYERGGGYDWGDKESKHRDWNNRNYERGGYDRGDEGYDSGDEGYDGGDEGYDGGDDDRGERDYGEGPPQGWRSYQRTPYGWEQRGCQRFGPLWYCP